MTLLRVEAIRKNFGGFEAVRDVSFELKAGERLAIIGPNGAGKTTCFRMIGGQIAPDGGRILLDGEEITGLPARKIWRKGVGRTFQVAATFGSMTVIENVQMALLSHHNRARALFPLARRIFRSEARELLVRVGIEEHAERHCSVLAYGDIKRVELAIALAHQPRLLLMDEPTAGMAPPERHALMRLVTEVVAEHRIAVLFTEHDMDVVFGYADRILVLNRGRLIAEGPPARVRNDPEVQSIYLGSAAGVPA